MRKLERLSPPECLNKTSSSVSKKKRNFYRNLRDSQGKIRPRWNTTCKNQQRVSRIRLRLLAMSDYCCAYCGKSLNRTTLNVDHYLPSSHFPYLSYCWENLLPACTYCNQCIKADFVPTSLQGTQIVEAILADEYPHEYVYDKAFILGQIAHNDRLLDPTFDDPEEHLTFLPEFFLYDAKTEIGHITISKFFLHKEVAERWEELSLFIKELVLKDTSEEIVRHYICLHDYEYVCWKFYEYWTEEKQAGRIG